MQENGRRCSCWQRVAVQADEASARVTAGEIFAELLLDKGGDGSLRIVRISEALDQLEDVDALHELIVAWLVVQISNWLGERGRVLTSDTKYAVSERRGRKPDITVYFTRARLPSRSVVRTPPDIAVEIVSSAPKDRRGDRVEKHREYAAFGIRFYWIVDPELRRSR